MNQLHGNSVLFHTLNKIITNFPNSKVVVAAPDFDANGNLIDEIKTIPSSKINLYFGHNESPLKRMIDANRKYLNGNYFLRLDALNMSFDPEEAENLWSQGCRGDFDCLKFDDDYPAQLTIDFYKLEALSKLSGELTEDSPFQVHPKYALFNNNYITSYFKPGRQLSKSLLLEARANAGNYYLEPRDEINQGIEIGDTLSFHYKLALPYIEISDLVLDIACGSGVGTKLLSTKANYVIGGDIDDNIIDVANKNYKELKNLKFVVEDVTKTNFRDNNFDLITSFETIEHVDDVLFLKEVNRILKSGGYFILSTPQNSQGAIPINPHHLIEYSLQEIIEKVSIYFDIIKIIGIKQGTIVIDGEPKGSNTFMVLKKP